MASTPTPPPAYDVSPLTVSEPLSTDAFSNYTLQITEEWETENGCGFTGDILKDGLIIFSFENDGNGGCNKYLPQGENSRQELRAFKELSVENFPDKLEADDYALIYLELRDQEENN